MSDQTMTTAAESDETTEDVLEAAITETTTQERPVRSAPKPGSNGKGKGKSTVRVSRAAAEADDFEPDVKAAKQNGKKPEPVEDLSAYVRVGDPSKRTAAASGKYSKKLREAEAAVLGLPLAKYMKIPADEAKTRVEEAAAAKAADAAAARLEKKAEKDAEKAAAAEAKAAAAVVDLTGLVTDAAPSTDLREIPVSALRSDSWGDPPSDQFIESVRKHGVQVPILVRENLDGTFEVVEGRRRAKAATEAELETITGVVQGKPINADVMALLLNAQRSGNLIDQYRHVKALLDAGYSRKQIEESVLMTDHQITKALSVGNLHPKLIAAVEDGTMLPSATLNASRLSKEDQAKLVKLHAKTGRITARDVSALRTAVKQEAVASVLSEIDGAGEMPALPRSDAEAEENLQQQAAERISSVIGEEVKSLAKLTTEHRRRMVKSLAEKMVLVLEAVDEKKLDDDLTDALMFARTIAGIETA